MVIEQRNGKPQPESVKDWALGLPSLQRLRNKMLTPRAINAGLPRILNLRRGYSVGAATLRERADRIQLHRSSDHPTDWWIIQPRALETDVN